MRSYSSSMSKKLSVSSLNPLAFLLFCDLRSVYKLIMYVSINTYMTYDIWLTSRVKGGKRAKGSVLKVP